MQIKQELNELTNLFYSTPRCWYEQAPLLWILKPVLVLQILSLYTLNELIIKFIKNNAYYKHESVHVFISGFYHKSQWTNV